MNPKNQATRGSALSKLDWIFLGILALLVSQAFLPSWSSFFRVWSSNDFSYGWIIAPVSIWLAWRSRARISGLRPETSLLGLIGLLGSVVVWFVGYLTATSTVLQAGAVMAVVCILVAYFGIRISLRMWFPLFFLLFMIPFGGAFTPILTAWTADFVEMVVRALGIPVYREAADFVLPTGKWSVVAACSGLRYTISAVILSVLFAHLNFSTWWKGVFFVIVAVFASIVGNWVRAALTVYVGHLTNMKWGPGEEHLWAGWVIFGLVMFIVARAGEMFREPEDRGYVKANVEASLENSSLRWLSMAALCLLLAALVAFPHVNRFTWVEPKMVSAVQGIPGKSIDRLVYEPKFKGLSAVARRQENHPSVQWMVAYFADQPRTAAMISTVNAILPDEENSDWRTLGLDREVIKGLNSEFSVSTIHLRKGDNRFLLVYWYHLRGGAVSGVVAGKLRTLKSILAGKGDHATLQIMLFPIEGNDTPRLRVEQKEEVIKVFERTQQLFGMDEIK